MTKPKQHLHTLILQSQTDVSWLCAHVFTCWLSSNFLDKPWLTTYTQVPVPNLSYASHLQTFMDASRIDYYGPAPKHLLIPQAIELAAAHPMQAHGLYAGRSTMMQNENFTLAELHESSVRNTMQLWVACTGCLVTDILTLTVES